MPTDRKFTLADIRRVWLLHRLEDPTMKHDPDSSDADDEFDEIMDDLQAKAWERAHDRFCDIEPYNCLSAHENPFRRE